MPEYLSAESTEQRTKEILKRTRQVVRLEQRCARKVREYEALRAELRTQRKFLRDLMAEHLDVGQVEVDLGSLQP